jgi:Na+/H+-translocating membrane pyrophosphatase
MIGGDLIVAAIALTGAEIATKTIELTCLGGRWPQGDLIFVSRALGVILLIVILFMLTINNDRVGRLEGPKVSVTRVVYCNLWGIIATLLSVGITAQWTHLMVMK